MRFVDAKGEDLVPRKDRIWSTRDVARRVRDVLEAEKADIPLGLDVVVQETAPTERATFAMHCYWVGEVKLGALDGVLATRAAWRGGLEVVEVTFDPKRLAYADLLTEARTLDCASKVFAHSDAQLHAARQAVGDLAERVSGDARPAKASDRHYHLGRAVARFVPGTPLQRTKWNAALGSGKPIEPWMTPRQKEWLGRIEAVLEDDAKALQAVAPAEDLAGLGAHVDALRKALDA